MRNRKRRDKEANKYALSPNPTDEEVRRVYALVKDPFNPRSFEKRVVQLYNERGFGAKLPLNEQKLVTDNFSIPLDKFVAFFCNYEENKEVLQELGYEDLLSTMEDLRKGDARLNITFKNGAEYLRTDLKDIFEGENFLNFKLPK